MDKLTQLYQRQWRYQRSCSRATVLLIAINLLAAPAIGGFTIWKAHADLNKPGGVAEMIFDIVAISVPIAAFALVWKRYRRMVSIDLDPAKVVAAPPAASARITQTMKSYAMRLSFTLKPLNILIQRRDFGVGVSVFEHKHSIDLIVPLGFLKFLRTSPSAADAMLAHEIGHLRANDTRLWAFASAFWAEVFRIIFPFDFLVILFVLVVSSIGAWRTSHALQGPHAQALAQLDTKWGVNYQHLSPSQAEVEQAKNPRVDDPNYFSIGSYDIDRMSVDSDFDRHGFDWSPAIFSTIETAFSMVLLLMVFAALRANRRISETMADLTAFSLVGEIPLLECLDGDESTEGRFFRIHPKRALRRRYLKVFVNLVSGNQFSALDERKVYNSPVKRKRWLLLAVLLFAPIYQIVVESAERRQSLQFVPFLAALTISCVFGWVLGNRSWFMRQGWRTAIAICVSFTWIFIVQTHLILFLQCWYHERSSGRLFDLASYASVRSEMAGGDTSNFSGASDVEMFWVVETVLFTVCGVAATTFVRRLRSSSSLARFA